MALVSEVLIPSRSEKLHTIEPGIYEGHTTAEFSVTKDFYRVLAKVAFHYYLAHNQRELRGDESGFTAIRRFIVEGEGSIDEFFRTTGPRFATPFGKAGNAKIICPVVWCHMLAAAEEKNSVVGYLRFYLGPRALPEPHYVTLGTIDSRLVLPRPAFGSAKFLPLAGKFASYLSATTKSEGLRSAAQDHCLVAKLASAISRLPSARRSSAARARPGA
jgi:hypothetical protein